MLTEKNFKLRRAKPHRDFYLMVFGTSESAVLLKYNSPVSRLTLWFRCIGNVFGLLAAVWQPCTVKWVKVKASQAILES